MYSSISLTVVVHLCRVRFSDGPLQERYGTPDGHPSHEGQTARQRRSLNTSYPVDLTPHSIRMLEQELGESYRLSINRLKRRHVPSLMSTCIKGLSAFHVRVIEGRSAISAIALAQEGFS